MEKIDMILFGGVLFASGYMVGFVAGYIIDVGQRCFESNLRNHNNGLIIQTNHTIRRSGKILRLNNSKKIHINTDPTAEFEDDIELMEGNYDVVDISRSVGHITINGGSIINKLIINSLNGYITINDVLVSGSLNISNINGSIKLHNSNDKTNVIDANSVIKTTNGSIDVDGKYFFNESLNIGTTNGSINVGNNICFKNYNRVSIKSINGDIYVPTRMNKIKIKTMNGDITFN